MTPIQPLETSAALPWPAPVPCPACDHVNPGGARFCNECGSPVDLSECPHCEAINEPAASHCYKCAGTLGIAAWPSEPRTADPLSRSSIDAAEPEGPTSEAMPSAPTAEPSIFESAAAVVAAPATASADGAAATDDQPAPAETTLHYVGGGFTAPADEAELDEVDVLADRRARRRRTVGYAAAALLVLPSLVATTLYGFEHPESVDQAIDYARVTIVTPLLRAARGVLGSQDDTDSAAASGEATAADASTPGNMPVAR